MKKIKLNVLNNYKGVIIFYIMIAILSILIVINNNRLNEMNLELDSVANTVESTYIN